MINKKLSLLYSLMVIPVSGAGMPVFVYILPYYANELALGLTAVGVIFFCGRFLDIFTDPLMGFFVDRYQTKKYKHKHWIIISVPLVIFSAYMIFFPISEFVNNFYLFLGLFLLYTSFTLLVITQLSWSVTLAPNYDNRTNLLTLRELMSLVSMFIVITIPAIIEIYTPSMTAKINGIGWFLCIFSPVILIIAVKNLPDHSTVESVRSFKSSLNVFKGFITYLDLNRVTIVSTLIAFGQSLTGALFIIVVDSIFELDTYASRAMLAYFLVSVIGLWFWRTLSLKYSKHQSLAACCIYASTILMISYLGYESYLQLSLNYQIFYLFVFVIVYGFSFSGPVPLINSMIGDLAENHKIKKGEDISGSIYAYVTTITKLGFALAAAVPYILLEEFFGFKVELGPQNSDSSKNILWNIYVFVPMFCYLISAVLIWSHPIKREVSEHTNEI